MKRRGTDDAAWRISDKRIARIPTALWPSKKNAEGLIIEELVRAGYERTSALGKYIKMPFWQQFFIGSTLTESYLDRLKDPPPADGGAKTPMDELLDVLAILNDDNMIKQRVLFF